MKHASPLDSALPPVSHVKSNSHHCIPLVFFQSAAEFLQKAARSIKAPGCKDQIHHSLFYHELPLRRLTHLTFDLDTNATWRWQTKLHNPMIYYMICWLATCEWIFAPPSTLSKSTLYQISNSLKTENSLTVLPRLLSVFRTESRRRRSSAKKKNEDKKEYQSAAKSWPKSVNVSMLKRKAGHNTVSPI